MTILFQESFDSPNNFRDGLQDLRWLWPAAATAWNISLTGGRFGDGAFNLTSNTNPIMARLNGNPTTTTVRLAFHLKFSNTAQTTIGGRPVIALVNMSPTTAVLLHTFYIYITSNVLQIHKFDDTPGSSNMTSGSVNVADNNWHHIEVELLAHTSTGVCKVWVDGVLDINYSGDTSDAAGGADVTVFNHILFGGGSGNGGTVNAFWDDIMVWDDNSGSGELTGHLPYPHRISLWTPDANGDVNNFTPSTGSNYQNVNPALIKQDTTYNEGSGVGDKDLYAIGANSLNPVAIYGVAMEHWARKEDLGTLTYKTILKSGGTEYDGETVTPSNGYFKRWKVWPQDPNGPVAWTKAGIEAAQIGVEILS